jgi:hypothetical protein
MTTTLFTISFWAIAQASKFAGQASLLKGVKCFNTENWTGSDQHNKRGHSPEVYNFFEVEEQSLNNFESLLLQIQGVTVKKDDEVTVEAIAPTDREQHRQWCGLSEEDYTDLFGTPEEQEQDENNDILDIWFGKNPPRSLLND